MGGLKRPEIIYVFVFIGRPEFSKAFATFTQFLSRKNRGKPVKLMSESILKPSQ